MENEKHSDSYDYTSSEVMELRAVIDFSTDYVFAKNREFRLILVNKSLADIMGMKVEDMENQFDFDVFPKENCFGNPEIGLRGYHDDDTEAFNGVSATVREKLIFADGVEHVFETNRTPLKDLNGKIYGVIGYSRDITNDILVDKKNKELELLHKQIIDSQERTVNLLSSATDGIIMTNSAGVILSFNRSSEILFGYKTDEIVGGNVDVLVPNEIRNKHDSFINQYHQHGKSTIIGKGRDVQGRHKDGHLIDLYISISQSVENGEKMFMALVHDISDKKKAIKLLEERESNFRLFANSSFEAIAVHESGLLIHANKNFFEMFQYTPEEVIGTQVIQLLLTPSSVVIAQQQILNKCTNSYEVECMRKDGSQFSAEILPRLDVFNGKEVRSTAIRDITEFKKNEKFLRDALIKAEAANHAKSLFISSMSHELRTPLNAVIGFSQLLLQNVSTGDVEESANEINIAGKHLLGLINDILDLSRIESDDINIVSKHIDVYMLVKNCLTLVGETANKSNISLSIENSILPVKKVIADEMKLKQIIINLLSNAVKYNEDNGSVTVRFIETVDDMVSIEISDTGPGLTAVNMSKLFKPFNRLEAENSNIQGTGIGLFITKKLAEKMNCRVGVTSVLGEGSTFTISVPISNDATCEGKSKPVVNDSVVALDEINLNILYVEDNVSNQILMEKILQVRETVKLNIEASAEAALVSLNDSIPDIILLDIDLPGVSGYQLFRQLESTPAYKDIPVIAVTANAMVNDVLKSKQYKFAAYITKPIVIEDLFDAIDKAKTLQ